MKLPRVTQHTHTEHRAQPFKFIEYRHTSECEFIQKAISTHPWCSAFQANTASSPHLSNTAFHIGNHLSLNLYSFAIVSTLYYINSSIYAIIIWHRFQFKPEWSEGTRERVSSLFWQNTHKQKGNLEQIMHDWILTVNIIPLFVLCTLTQQHRQWAHEEWLRTRPE